MTCYTLNSPSIVFDTIEHEKVQSLFVQRIALHVQPRQSSGEKPPSLGVEAAVRVRSFLNSCSNTNTVLVATRVSNSSRCPDGPGTVNAVRTSNQVLASKLEVSLLDSPSLPFRVLGSGLSTGRVADQALAFVVELVSTSKSQALRQVKTYPCQNDRRRFLGG